MEVQPADTKCHTASGFIPQAHKAARVAGSNDVDAPYKEVDAIPSHLQQDQDQIRRQQQQPLEDRESGQAPDEQQQEQFSYQPGDCIVQVSKLRRSAALHNFSSRNVQNGAAGD